MSSYEPPVEKPQTAEGLRTSYVYDDFGAIETIADPTGDELSFSYDHAGRVSGVTHSLDQVTFEYLEKTGQLGSVNSQEQTQTYTYDGSLPAAVAWSGTITGTVSLSFDEHARLAEMSYGADSFQHSYDDDGLLLGVGPLGIDRDAASGQITATQVGSIRDLRTYGSDGLLASYAVTYASPFYERSSYLTTPPLPAARRLHRSRVRLRRGADWPRARQGVGTQGFAGGLYDADTGLVRFGARDYDARVGRWTAS